LAKSQIQNKAKTHLIFSLTSFFIFVFAVMATFIRSFKEEARVWTIV